MLFGKTIMLSQERLTKHLVNYGPIKVIPDGGGNPVVVVESGKNTDLKKISLPDGINLIVSVTEHLEKDTTDHPSAYVGVQVSKESTFWYRVGWRLLDGEQRVVYPFRVKHEKPMI
jgi:hypothetical protein